MSWDTLRRRKWGQSSLKCCTKGLGPQKIQQEPSGGITPGHDQCCISCPTLRKDSFCTEISQVPLGSLIYWSHGMFNNDSLSYAGYKWAAGVRAACTETPRCDGQVPTAPEQYSLGAAFGAWKQILGYLVEDNQERSPGMPVFDIGVFAAPAGQSHRLLGSKQGHLATWRPGWNLNSKGVKFQTKSMSPLKSAWPLPSHPFGFPLIGPQRAGGFRALPGPWPSAGGWGQPILCMVQLGAILQFSLTRIQASFCRHKEPNSPEVQFVHQYKLLLSHPLHTIPLPCRHIPASFHVSNLSFPNRLGMVESRDSRLDSAHLFSPQSISAIPAFFEKIPPPSFPGGKRSWVCLCCFVMLWSTSCGKASPKIKIFSTTDTARDSQEDKVWLPLLSQNYSHDVQRWVTGLGKGPSPSRKMFLLPRLRGKKIIP